MRGSAGQLESFHDVDSAAAVECDSIGFHLKIKGLSHRNMGQRPDESTQFRRDPEIAGARNVAEKGFACSVDENG